MKQGCSPRVALVAMPWSQRDRPSAAIAALSAYVRRERPSLRVECHSAFLDVAAAIGPDLYRAIADDAYTMGELLYTPLLYPETRENVRAAFEEWARLELDQSRFADVRDWGSAFDALLDQLAAHLGELADSLAESCDVIGATTSFGQLFGNLALARAVKQRAPAVRIVIGGSTVSSRVGPSLLAEYAWLDCVVQGEGEQPFVAILDSIAHGEPLPSAPGVLSRASGSTPAAFSEVSELDRLPTPDYDEYAAKASAHAIDWAFTLEGSRGCWWDRTKRTGNPKNTCYFCNLNVQWGGYREKSAARIASDIRLLTERHKTLKVYFVDNIARAHGHPEVAEAIRSLGLDLEIFMEFRANATPYDLLASWEAGIRLAQFGIEALSSPLLKRIGKGTTTIQNLQAMRLCAELGIRHSGNLIVDFPGTTDREIAESRQTILDYALAYEPLSFSRFHLGVDATVDALRAEFGIHNVRNADRYRLGLPEDVWRRLALFELDFDRDTPAADPAPLKEACAQWRALHRGRVARLLTYRDGGTFIYIEDERFGDFRAGTFDGLAREVYLHCTEIRTREALARRFASHPEATKLDTILDEFVAERLMFREGARYLSLALAPDISAAASRIRAAHAETPTRAVIRLPLAQHA